MSSRLAFQTQLASIMEVLANAAVAEICKLVDDDYALVSLQMSQCQRENKALKRKLHLLELKMARGAAERRLRDGATSGGRTRVQLAGGDRLRDATAADGGAFERQVEASVWPAGAAGDGPGEPLLSEGPHNQSPDVELVEPEALLVKEERLEPNMSQEEDAEEDLRLIRDDGILECARGAAAERPAFQPQDTHNHSVKGRGDGRGVEVSGSSPLLKSELGDSVEEALNVQQDVHEGAASCDFTDDTNSPTAGFCDPPSGADTSRPSCSYSMAAVDFPSTSSSINGWNRYEGAFPPPRTFNDGCTPPKEATRGARERLFVCSYCGKAFNRPKKVEIHQRVHTGEKPFHCTTCGKMFSEAGNLRKHQRVHTGEKPYCCTLCGRGFAWIRNLKTHQLKSHPEVCFEEENWTAK